MRGPYVLGCLGSLAVFALSYRLAALPKRTKEQPSAVPPSAPAAASS
jgi:hypothetical protein